MKVWLLVSVVLEGFCAVAEAIRHSLRLLLFGSLQASVGMRFEGAVSGPSPERFGCLVVHGRRRRWRASSPFKTANETYTPILVNEKSVVCVRFIVVEGFVVS